jgi:Ca2+-binding EF-hand superfamily protein
MKRFSVTAVLIAAVSLCALTIASADKANGKKAKLIAKYDKNGNGVIDGQEKDALRKDFAADQNGELKRFDKDNDGKLSDEEIAAIKPGSGKGKSGEKSKTKTNKENSQGDNAKDEKKSDSKK